MHESTHHHHAGHEECALGAHSKASSPAAVYTCPMHPEVRQSKPGSCLKCGMALECALAPTPAKTAWTFRARAPAPAPAHREEVDGRRSHSACDESLNAGEDLGGRFASVTGDLDRKPIPRGSDAGLRTLHCERREGELGSVMTQTRRARHVTRDDALKALGGQARRRQHDDARTDLLVGPGRSPVILELGLSERHPSNDRLPVNEGIDVSIHVRYSLASLGLDLAKGLRRRAVLRSQLAMVASLVTVFLGWVRGPTRTEIRCAVGGVGRVGRVGLKLRRVLGSCFFVLSRRSGVF